MKIIIALLIVLTLFTSDILSFRYHSKRYRGRKKGKKYRRKVIISRGGNGGRGGRGGKHGKGGNGGNGGNTYVDIHHRYY